MVSRLEHATHIGGCGFCTGFGTRLRQGMSKYCALEAGIGTHRQHVGGLLGRLAPHRASSPPAVDAEAVHLQRAWPTSPVPHSTRPFETRSSVAMRSATRAGMVVVRRHQHDAMAEPDALGALRAGGEEHLRRGGVRVFLEEVVLDLPDVVDAEPVGELDLVERVLDDAALGVLAPGPRQLMLVEHAEFHLASSRSNDLSGPSRYDELPRRVFLRDVGDDLDQRRRVRLERLRQRVAQAAGVGDPPGRHAEGAWRRSGSPDCAGCEPDIAALEQPALVAQHVAVGRSC